MNNLAYAMGQKAIWQNGYYVGTFSEYNMNAVRPRFKDRAKQSPTASTTNTAAEPTTDAEALRFAIYRKRAEALPMTSDAAQFNQVKRRLDRLTMRERQVLDMLVQGKPLKQIAARLGTSPSTVKNQRRTIFEKLGATCDVDVVRMLLLGSSTAMSSASRDAGEVG
jgi:RNA polymerase sigma factor (sigma-70 family)